MPPLEYVLPAVVGTQAGRRFYVTMCPLGLVPAIFPISTRSRERSKPPHGVVNAARVPEIAEYLVRRRSSYVLSALTASVDGRLRFQRAGKRSGTASAGMLHMTMSARCVLHDGVQRCAAIKEALLEEPVLASETIPVVLFPDPGLARYEQIFGDLKHHESRVSRSLSILHDHGDENARLTRALVSRVPLFASHTELQRSKISNRSLKLFTLSGIYHGTSLLLAGRLDSYAAKLADATAFWSAVVEQIPEWQLAASGKVAPADLRRTFVHSHALALAALGRAGRALLEKNPRAWRRIICRLHLLDWSRSNVRLWEGRAMIAGRLSKATTCVVLTSNAIKQHLGLELTDDEAETERRFRSRA